MKLLCKLIGHKSRQYLQVTESSNGEVWCEDGMNITKKIHTHFLCSRCYHRYKQIESYCKEQHGDRV